MGNDKPHLNGEGDILVMIITFWNVHGLGDWAKHIMVSETCHRCNIEIICLEETKLYEPHDSVLRDIGGCGGFEWAIKNSRGASRGILIRTKISVFGQIASRCDRYSLSVIIRHRSDG